MKIEYNNLYTHFASGKFSWQQSASAFSVSKSDIDKVCKYILNQSDRHRKVSSAEEYDQFLKYYEEKLKE